MFPRAFVAGTIAAFAIIAASMAIAEGPRPPAKCRFETGEVRAIPARISKRYALLGMSWRRSPGNAADAMTRILGWLDAAPMPLSRFEQELRQLKVFSSCRSIVGVRHRDTRNAADVHSPPTCR